MEEIGYRKLWKINKKIHKNPLTFSSLMWYSTVTRRKDESNVQVSLTHIQNADLTQIKQKEPKQNIGTSLRGCAAKAGEHLLEVGFRGSNSIEKGLAILTEREVNK